MFNIFIVDDNLIFTKKIESYIKEYTEKSSVFKTCQIHIQNNNFKQFAYSLPKNSSKHNIYLIDINLHSSITGLALAKEIRQFDFDGYIIILTSHVELVGSSYSYNIKALNFIDKSHPNFNLQLISSFEQILHEINSFSSLESKDEKITFLIFKYKNRQYKVYTKDIIYIETNLLKRCLLIHTTTVTIEYGGTLTKILNELPNYFFRCHKSYILNSRHIKEIELELPNYRAVFNYNMACVISKKYIPEPFDLIAKL